MRKRTRSLKWIFSFSCLLLLFQAALAQGNIKVSGKVVSGKDKVPLAGATITEENGKGHAVADANGNFTIDVPQGSKIRVTMTGYDVQVVKASGTINLALALADNKLDEVVVVGYGTQKKRSATSAVSNIKAEEVALIPTSNLSNVLAGRLSGTFVNTGTGTPGISSGVRVRAQSSWNGSDAIYVIDGVVRDKVSFDALDPNEVSEISVLKDAASAAIYGSRSSNGVILVTTKTGKSGRTVIDFSTVLSGQKVGKMPSYMDVHDGLKLSQAVNGGIGDDEIEWVLKNNPKGENYYDAAYQDPNNQKYALSASGGTDAINYYIGGSYYNEKGFLPNVSYGKYNIRGKINAKLTKDLSIGLNVNTSYGDRKRFNFTYDYGSSDLNNLWGKLLYWDAWAPAYIDGKPVNPGWLGNPIEMMKNGGYWRGTNQQIDALLNLTYKVPFIKGLTASGAFSKNFNNNYIKNFAQKQLLYDFVTTGTNNLIRTNEVKGTTISGDPGTEYIGNEYYKNNTYQLNAQLSYNNSFGKHHVNGDAVYEQFEGYGNAFSAYRYTFPLAPIDQFFAGSGDSKNWTNNGSESQDGRMSYIFRAGYDYDGKYLLNASLRRDGSVKFAPDKRWGNFPTVSAGWVLSKEKFYESLGLNDKINFVKLRFSYGATGNDAIGGWQWVDQYNIQNSSYYLGTSGTSAPRLAYGGIPNPNLTWEKSNSYDAALEVNFLKHFAFTGDFWKRHTYDILGSRILAIPAEFGSSLPAENYGIVNSHGIELELSYNNTIGKDFSYALRGNFSIAKTEVEKRDVAANALDVDNPNGKSLNYGTGYLYDGILRTDKDLANLPAGLTYFGASPTLGSANFRDISGVDRKPDGKVDSYDRVVLGNYFGSGSAPYSFGLLVNLKYKGFSFETLVAGLAGFKNAYNDPWGRNFGGGAKVPEYHADSWSATNPNGSTPKIYPWGNPQSYGYTQTSTFNVYDASFVRLKYINLGYSLPAKMVQKIGLKSLDIFVSGNNLFYFSKFKAYDPELYQWMSYPIMKVFSAGVNIKI